MLIQEYLWDIVEPPLVQAFSFLMFGGSSGIASSTSPTLTTTQVESLWKQKCRALTIINLSIKDKINIYIMGIQEPKDVWEVLKKLFKTKDSSRRMLIWNKLTNLKMDETTSMEDFRINTKDLLNQLVGFGKNIIKDVLVKMVFNVLPLSFDHFV